MSFLVCLSWKSGIRHERAGWLVCVQQSLFWWRVLVLAWKSDFPGWATPPSDSSLLSTFSSGKLEAAPFSSVHFCTGFQPNWTDCPQQTQPLFQAVLCTAGTVNWGTVSADVCLGKLSVLDCIQLQYSDKRSYSSLAIVQLLILLQNGSCFNCLVDLDVVFLITVIILILNCSFRWSVFFHVSRISWSWKYTLEKVSIFSIFFFETPFLCETLMIWNAQYMFQA